MSPRIGREMLRRGCIQERPVIEVAGMGEAPPLIIPVDLGGDDWLEPVIEAAGMVGSLALGHP